jgi:hypothetical protein
LNRDPPIYFRAMSTCASTEALQMGQVCRFVVSLKFGSFTCLQLGHLTVSEGDSDGFGMVVDIVSM